jgi:hypothetical protein
MRNQMLMAAAAAISLGSNSGYPYGGVTGKQGGQFQLQKWSILKCDGRPTYHTGGTLKYQAPKPPRAKFTREQRISAAKNLRREQLTKIASDARDASETFYRLIGINPEKDL